MANRNLLPVYKKLYGDDFSYYDFDKRMQMQKAVYLLTEMGVPVGDYGFRWYLHGPYSQELHDDMYYENGRKPAAIEIFSEYDQRIKKLHEIIDSKDKGSYTPSEWMECIASIRYLRRNVLPLSAEEDDVLADLVKRKPHLKHDDINRKAYEIVKELFA